MDMMSYLMGRNSGGGGKGAKIEVVTELPETGEANVIYLVPKQDEDENNVFDEYLYINDEWELIGSTAIDISGKQDTMQFSTMPTANVETVGKIVQYIGTTNVNYTKGYFYIGVTNGEETPTYDWVRIDLQPTPGMAIEIITEPKTKIWEYPTGIYYNEQSVYPDNNGLAQAAPRIIFVHRDNTYVDVSLYNLKDRYINTYKMHSKSGLKTGDDNIWYYLYNVVVSGSDQVISGTKTFNNIPRQSSTTAPTLDTQFTNKKYVDDSIAAAITTTLGGSY